MVCVCTAGADALVFVSFSALLRDTMNGASHVVMAGCSAGQEDTEAKGVIALKDCVSVKNADEETGKENSFLLHAGDRTYFFVADTPGARQSCPDRCGIHANAHVRCLRVHLCTVAHSKCMAEDKMDWVNVLSKAILVKANVQTLNDHDDAPALMVSANPDNALCFLISQWNSVAGF